MTAQLIYGYLASLDGYVHDEQGVFDWAEPEEEVLAFLNQTERSTGTYLYGRRMYELMTGWETDPALAAHSPGNREFARIWQQASKVVFSRTLQEVSTERTRIERSLDATTLAALKEGTDQDLCVSGADLAATAWRLGAIDQVHLYVAPVVVGGGRRMFPDGVRERLELVDERRFSGGMVFLRYAVVHDT